MLGPCYGRRPGPWAPQAYGNARARGRTSAGPMVWSLRPAIQILRRLYITKVRPYAARPGRYGRRLGPIGPPQAIPAPALATHRLDLMDGVETIYTISNSIY